MVEKIKNTMDRYKNIIEDIKKISTEDLSDDVVQKPNMKIIEKQAVFYWIRIHLSSKKSDEGVSIEDLSYCENLDTVNGDEFSIFWVPTGEKIDATFISYGKKGLVKDSYIPEIVGNLEDDRSVLIIMVNEEYFISDEVPILRTFFKGSKYYTQQAYRKSDLLLVNKRTNESINYITIDF
jgi:hypothetical protein